MLIIAINTASQKPGAQNAIALIEIVEIASGITAGTVLGEESWHSNRNESERVLPGLNRLLKEAGRSWENVDGVFVIKGPGSYTSLRVGITIANTIAWVRKIPLWTTDLSAIEGTESNPPKTFGQTIASLDFTQLEKTDRATPLYAAPPRITPRKR